MAALAGLSCLPKTSGTFPFVGLLTIFLSIQVLVCMCRSDYENYPECSQPFECGFIKGISYPFRQRDNPEYCGEPGFDLYCEGGSPMITFNSASYQVLALNTRLKSLTVVPINGVGNLICSLGLVNTSLILNLSPFYPAWSTGTIALYNSCPTNTNQYKGLSNHQFNCTNVGIDLVGYFVVTSAFSNLSVAAKNALRSCHSKVTLPAFDSILHVLKHNPSTANMFVTLENGFGLQWNESNFPSAEEIQKANNRPLEKEKLHGSFTLKHKVIIGVTVAATSIMGLICILYLIIFKRKGGSASSENSRKHKENIDAFIKTYGSRGPNRYSRYDIKKMTNKFAEKLGQGGYGTVYKGKLSNGQLVAVKVLSDSKGNGEEFLNEVASISRTSHVNIVTLLGFCYEKSKRALVYEFMPNGSLDKFIYCQGSDRSRQLEWKTLNDIALGIARGLEYLHQGCNTRILHFDIKPHNILLDENFYPKIADFGLSKLCERKESTVSLIGARGTAGYIAPEVFCRHYGGVSHKSDVYSYGMMVLEMVGGRKNIDVEVSKTSEIYFPSWIYKHLDHAMKQKLHGVIIEDEEEEEITRKLIIVSLWCIQYVPTNRPSMTKVLEMLQGSLQSLEIPPRPFVSSPVRSP